MKHFCPSSSFFLNWHDICINKQYKGGENIALYINTYFQCFKI